MKTYSFEAIRKYLNKSPLDRPILRTIQRNKAGQQFILDGFSAYIFKQNTPELDALPQMGAGASAIGIEHIIPKAPAIKITDNDRKVLKRAHNYSKWLKSKGIDDYYHLIHIFGRVFNAQMIVQAIDILGKDFSELTVYASENPNTPVHLTTTKIDAVLLPVRTDGDEAKFQKRTEEFLEAA